VRGALRQCLLAEPSTRLCTGGSCLSVCLSQIKLVKFVSFSYSVCAACVLACFNFFVLAWEKNFEILLWAGQAHSYCIFGLCDGLRECGMCVSAGLTYIFHKLIICSFIFLFLIIKKSFKLLGSNSLGLFTSRM
jgi:hypothetical protein